VGRNGSRPNIKKAGSEKGRESGGRGKGRHSDERKHLPLISIAVALILLAAAAFFMFASYDNLSDNTVGEDDDEYVRTAPATPTGLYDPIYLDDPTDHAGHDAGEFTYDDNGTTPTLTFNNTPETNGNTYEITQTNNEALTIDIIIPAGVNVTLILNGIFITGKINIADSETSSLELLLTDKNVIKGMIVVPKNATLIIDSYDLPESSDGELKVTAPDGNGITCIGNYAGGNIEINGGTVTAIGGNRGYSEDFAEGMTGTITINGGMVTATSGNGDYSYAGMTGTITINGGTVNAVGHRGASGISGTVITINDGTVIATGGKGGYHGVGGSGIYSDGSGSGINISGGNVTASGGDGVGTFNNHHGGHGLDGRIIISGGTVTATGGDGAFDDTFSGEGGSGIYSDGPGSGINISGGNVTAIGGDCGNVGGTYGKGGYGIFGEVTISDGIVTATGGDNTVNTSYPSSGIDAIKEITGGTVTAYGGYGGAGAILSSDFTITKEATFTAHGGHGGTGISIFAEEYDDIITGDGALTAYGGEGGAGMTFEMPYDIYGSHGSITITGNIALTAYGGEGGAGMVFNVGYEKIIIAGNVTLDAYGGEGGAGTKGAFQIVGGTVTVTGGDGAAGVRENIVVNGGTVTITGGDGAAGIDGKLYVNGGTVTVKGGDGAAGIYGVINITDGTLTAIGSGGGEGMILHGGICNWTGGALTAIGSGDGAGINIVNAGLLMSGGTVTAIGSGDGAGIITNSIYPYGIYILIEGTVTAIGSGNGAGIEIGECISFFVSEGSDIKAYSTGTGKPAIVIDDTTDGYDRLFSMNATLDVTLSATDDTDILVFADGDRSDLLNKLTLPAKYLSFGFITNLEETYNLYAKLSAENIRIMEMDDGSNKVDISSVNDHTVLVALTLRSLPTIEEPSVTNVGSRDAGITHSYDLNGYPITDSGYRYSTEIDDDGKLTGNITSVSWSDPASGTLTTIDSLLPNTTYYVIAFMVIDEAYWFGDILESEAVEFKTLNAYTLASSSSSGGTIEYHDGTDWVSLPQTKEFTENSNVMVRANSADEYGFSYWSGYLSGTVSGMTDGIKIVMNGNRTIEAHFYDEDDFVTLSLGTAAVNGKIMWSVGSSTPAELDAAGIKLDTGTTVKLEAVPDAGFKLVNWTDDLSGNKTDQTLIIDDNKTIGAVFEPGKENVDYFVITLDDSTGGKISYSLTGTEWEEFPIEDGTASMKFPMNSIVYLRAESANNYVFSYWTGIGAGENNPYVFTGKGSFTVGAVFIDTDVPELDYFVITYEEAENGKVMWSFDRDKWWSFPDDGTMTFFATAGTIYLKAVPDAGYKFASWTGGADSSTDVFVYVEKESFSVSATFTDGTADVDYFTITLGNADNGEIMYSLTGNGTDWETLPSTKNFVAGTTVYLYAKAAPNYEFSYWTGVGAGENNPYVFKITSNVTVGAVFIDTVTGTEDVDYFIITFSGAVDGKVMWSFDNSVWWDFPSDGTKTFLTTVGTIYLKAAPDAGYKFSSWIGVTSSTDVYTYTAKTALTVSAEFVTGTEGVDYFTITLGNADNGEIMYSFTGNGTDWEKLPASKTFVTGTTVYLYAKAAPNYEFSYWDGVSSLLLTYEYTVDKNITVGAVFVKTVGPAPDKTYTLTPDAMSNGSLTISINGNDAIPFTSPITLPENTSVVITAVPSTNYEFSYWAGIGAGESNPYAFKVTSNVTLGAVFVDVVGGIEDVDYFVITYDEADNGKVMWSFDNETWWPFPDDGKKTFPATVDDVYFKAIPDAGFKLSNWINVTSETDVYVYTGKTSLTVSAEFEVILYTITITADEGSSFKYTINGGDPKEFTIGSSGSYAIKDIPYGSSVTIESMPREGYEASWNVGDTVKKGNVYEFTIYDDIELTVTFSETLGYNAEMMIWALLGALCIMAVLLYLPFRGKP
jgi:hypothetical protein